MEDVVLQWCRGQAIAATDAERLFEQRLRLLEITRAKYDPRLTKQTSPNSRWIHKVPRHDQTLISHCKRGGNLSLKIYEVGHPDQGGRPGDAVCVWGLRQELCQPCSPLGIFFFNDPATTEIYTLSLHDALPISSA